jgi:hypothetical protein
MIKNEPTRSPYSNRKGFDCPHYLVGEVMIEILLRTNIGRLFEILGVIHINSSQQKRSILRIFPLNKLELDEE